MIRFGRAAALFLAILSLAPRAEALSLSEGAQPAELPPAGYASSTYVDSRGCIYIRAGVGGATNWVPRVTRSREVVCGAKPTGGARAAAAPSVPVEKPAPVVKPAPVAAVAPRVTAPAPAVAPVAAPVVAPVPAKPTATSVTQTVRLACPAGGANKNVRTSAGLTLPLRCDADQTGTNTYLVRSGNQMVRVVVSAPPRAKPQPQVRTVARPPVVTAPAAPKQRTVRITCPDRAGVAQVYASDGSMVPARCGPQTKEPVTYYLRYPDGRTVKVDAIPAGTGRVRQQSSLSGPAPSPWRTKSQSVAPSLAAPVRIPAGYKPVWEDDRLNPNRGPRTAAGDQAMSMVWTDTLPRRLVAQTPVRR